MALEAFRQYNELGLSQKIDAWKKASIPDHHSNARFVLAGITMTGLFDSGLIGLTVPRSNVGDIIYIPFLPFNNESIVVGDPNDQRNLMGTIASVNAALLMEAFKTPEAIEVEKAAFEYLNLVSLLSISNHSGNRDDNGIQVFIAPTTPERRSEFHASRKDDKALALMISSKFINVPTRGKNVIDEERLIAETGRILNETQLGIIPLDYELALKKIQELQGKTVKLTF